MIAYHEGNGVLVPVAGSTKSADKVSFDDTVTRLNVSNVQDAIVKLHQYFVTTFPGWVLARSGN